MGSQNLTNCCIAAIARFTATTLHSPPMPRLAFGAFCLAIHSFGYLAKAADVSIFQNLSRSCGPANPTDQHAPPPDPAGRTIAGNPDGVSGPFDILEGNVTGIQGT